jgi:hypothetical protein
LMLTYRHRRATVMVSAGPPSKPVFTLEKPWMPASVGMTDRVDRRVGINAGWSCLRSFAFVCGSKFLPGTNQIRRRVVRRVG